MTLTDRLFSRIVRMPDDPAVAAAAPAAAPAADAPRGLNAAPPAAAPAAAAHASDPAAAPPAAAPPAPYVPDGLADQFKGASDKETIDKLHEAVKAVPKPPAKADEYKLDLTPDQQKRFGDMSKDPVWGLAREAAHEASLDNASFQKFFSGLYDRLHKANLLDTGPDPAAELGKLMPKTGTDAERRTAALARHEAAVTGLQQLVNAGILDKADQAKAASLTEDAAGVVILEKLIGALAGKGVSLGGTPPAAADTEEARTARMYPSMAPKAA